MYVKFPRIYVLEAGVKDSSVKKKFLTPKAIALNFLPELDSNHTFLCTRNGVM